MTLFTKIDKKVKPLPGDAVLPLRQIPPPDAPKLEVVRVRAGLHGGKFLPFFRYSALSCRVLVHILSCCTLVSCRVSFSFRGMSEIHEGPETPETISQRFRSSAVFFQGRDSNHTTLQDSS